MHIQLVSVFLAVFCIQLFLHTAHGIELVAASDAHSNTALEPSEQQALTATKKWQRGKQKLQSLDYLRPVASKALSGGAFQASATQLAQARGKSSSSTELSRLFSPRKDRTSQDITYSDRDLYYNNLDVGFGATAEPSSSSMEGDEATTQEEVRRRDLATDTATYISSVAGSSVAAVHAPIPGQSWGSSLAVLPDINGDGFYDVLVGAEGTSSNEGRVYIYIMDAEQLPTTAAEIQPRTVPFPPFSASMRFGRSVCHAGDVSGDGAPDFAVGADGSGTWGLHIFSSQVTAPYFQYLHHVGGAVISVAAAFVEGDGFGHACSLLHSSPGGASTLLVGAPFHSSFAGMAASVTFTSLPAGSTLGMIPAAAADASLASDTAQFGKAVLALPDVNADGSADAAISAPYTGGNIGRVFIMHLRPGGSLLGTPAIPISAVGAGWAGSSTDDDLGSNACAAGPTIPLMFGASLAFEPDAGGTAALLVGAPGLSASTGAVFVVQLGFAGQRQRLLGGGGDTLIDPASFFPTSDPGGGGAYVAPGAYFGEALVAIPHVNGSAGGRSRLLVSAPDPPAEWLISLQLDQGDPFGVLASAIQGSPCGNCSAMVQAATQLPPPAAAYPAAAWPAQARAAGAMATLWGLSNATHTAVAVAEWHNSASVSGQDVVRVLMVHRDSLHVSQLATVTPSMSAGLLHLNVRAELRFGYALAEVGDVNADGRAELAVTAAPVAGGLLAPVLLLLHLDADGGFSSFTSIDTFTESVDVISPASDFGASIVAAGDLMGLGAPVLFVGAPAQNSRGTVHMLALQPGGTVGQHVNLMGSSPTVRPDFARFGSSLAVVPDQTGDSVCDLLIGAPGMGAGAGEVFLLELSANGSYPSVTRIQAIQLPGALLRYAFKANGGGLGASLLYLGDVDGDGSDDVLVGALTAKLQAAPGSPGAGFLVSLRDTFASEPPVVFGVLAPALGGWNSTLQHFTNLTQSMTMLGASSSGSGSGSLSVLLGAPSAGASSNGAVWAIKTRLSVTASSTAPIWASCRRPVDESPFAKSSVFVSQAHGGLSDIIRSNAGMGASIAVLGPLFPGGMPVVAVGEPRGIPAAGQVRLLWMDHRHAETPVRHIVQLTGGGGHVFLGRALCAVGDLNMDGVPDLMASAVDALLVFFLKADGTQLGLVVFSFNDSPLNSVGAIVSTNNFGAEIVAAPRYGGHPYVFISAFGAHLTSPPAAEHGKVYLLRLDQHGDLRSIKLLDRYDSTPSRRYGSSLAMLPEMVPGWSPGCDMAVGAPANGGDGTGAIIIVDLDDTGMYQSGVELTAAAVSPVFPPIGALGASLAYLGDLEGDGLPNLAIGSERTSDAVFHVNLNGSLGTVFSTRGSQHAVLSALSSEVQPALGADDVFGAALALLQAGPHTPVPQLLVGAPEIEVGGSTRGGMFSFSLASAAGWAGPAPGLLPACTAPVQLVTSNNARVDDASVVSLDEIDSGLGRSVASLGSASTGWAHMAVGAPRAGGGLNPGRVEILRYRYQAAVSVDYVTSFGPGTAGGPPLLLTAGFGRAVAAVGDIDSNTMRDIAVSGGRVNNPLNICLMGGSFLVFSCTVHRLDHALLAAHGLELQHDFGASLAPLPMSNPSPSWELAVGAPGFPSTGMQDSGALFVVKMARSSPYALEAAAEIGQGSLPGGLGLLPGSAFGNSIALVSDLNGDAVSDLIVGGERCHSNPEVGGVLWLLFRGVGALLRGFRVITAVSVGADPVLRFGASLQWLGARDAMQLPLLLVGAPTRDAALHQGAVLVLQVCGLDNCSAVVDTLLPQDLQSPALVQGSSQFGSSVAVLDFGTGAGEVQATVLVGSPGHNGALAGTGAVHSVQLSTLQDFTAGALAVRFVPPRDYVRRVSSLRPQTAQWPTAADPTAELGKNVAAVGDINGDGFMDIAMTARRQSFQGSQTGGVYIVFLSADGLSTIGGSVLYLTSPGMDAVRSRGISGIFGFAVGSAGDVDGNGVPDLVTAGGVSLGVSNVILLLLNGDGSILHATASLSTDAAMSGTVLASNAAVLEGVVSSMPPRLAGTARELLVLTPSWDSGGEPGSGAVHFLSVDSSGSIAAGHSIVAADAGLGSSGLNFGASAIMAPDLNGDGLRDMIVGAPGFVSDMGRVLCVHLSAAHVVLSQRPLVPRSTSAFEVAFNGQASTVRYGSSLQLLAPELLADGTLLLAVGATSWISTGFPTGTVLMLQVATSSGFADYMLRSLPFEKVLQDFVPLRLSMRLGDSIAVWPNTDSGTLHMVAGVSGMAWPDATIGGAYSLVTSLPAAVQGGHAGPSPQEAIMRHPGFPLSSASFIDFIEGVPTGDRNEYFGASVGALGALGGFGTQAFAVGATRHPSAVYVVIMSADLSRKLSYVKHHLGVGGPGAISASTGLLYWGQAATGIGDMNGDGTIDIGLSFSTGTNHGYRFAILCIDRTGHSVANAVFDFRDVGAPHNSPRITAVVAAAQDRVDHITALSGINNGLYGGFVLGMSMFNDGITAGVEGMLVVVHMGGNLTVASVQEVTQPLFGTSDRLGYSSTLIMDVSGDSFADLAVMNQPGTHMDLIAMGSAGTMLSVTANVPLSMPSTPQMTPSIWSLGRFTADGSQDILLGIPGGFDGLSARVRLSAGHTLQALDVLDKTNAVLAPAWEPDIFVQAFGSAMLGIPSVGSSASMAIGVMQYDLPSREDGAVMLIKSFWRPLQRVDIKQHIFKRNGAAALRVGPGAGLPLASTWHSGDQLGAALALLAGGTGSWPMVVATGAPSDVLNWPATGAVRILASTGGGFNVLASLPPPQLATGAAVEGFGSSLAAPGDVNHDGVNDLVVGSLSGHVTVLLLGVGPSVLGSTVTLLHNCTQPGIARTGLAQQATGVYQQISMAALNDTLGDGLATFALGLPLFVSPLSTADATGAWFVLRLNSAGHIVQGLQHDITALTEATKLRTFRGELYRYGCSIASVGDVDLDGMGDVAVGMPQAPHRGGIAVHLMGADYSIIRSSFSTSFQPSLYGLLSMMVDLDLMAFGHSMAPLQSRSSTGNVRMLVASSNATHSGSVLLVELDSSGRLVDAEPIVNGRDLADMGGDQAFEAGHSSGFGASLLSIEPHNDSATIIVGAPLQSVFTPHDGTVWQVPTNLVPGAEPTLVLPPVFRISVAVHQDWYQSRMGSVAGSAELGSAIVDTGLTHPQLGTPWVAIGAPGGAATNSASGDVIMMTFTYQSQTLGALRAVRVDSPLQDPALTAGPFTRFGRSLASAGDVNGDGHADLAVGLLLPGDVSALMLVMLDGDATPVTHRLLDWRTEASLQRSALGASVAEPGFGVAMASIGDRNGDGVPDLMVGAPGLTQPSPGVTVGAAVIVYLTSTAGVAGSHVMLASSLDSQHGVDAAGLGSAVVSLGDTNGDGEGDAAMAAQVGGGGTGAVILLHLAKSGVIIGAIDICCGAVPGVLSRVAGTPGLRIGAGLGRAGDFDGDGSEDLLVGMRSDDSGAAGTATLSLSNTSAPVLLQYVSASDIGGIDARGDAARGNEGFGASVAVIHDTRFALSSTPRSILLIGAPLRYTESDGNDGAVHAVAMPRTAAPGPAVNGSHNARIAVVQPLADPVFSAKFGSAALHGVPGLSRPFVLVDEPSAGHPWGAVRIVDVVRHAGNGTLAMQLVTQLQLNFSLTGLGPTSVLRVFAVDDIDGNGIPDLAVRAAPWSTASLTGVLLDTSLAVHSMFVNTANSSPELAALPLPATVEFGAFGAFAGAVGPRQQGVLLVGVTSTGAATFCVLAAASFAYNGALSSLACVFSRLPDGDRSMAMLHPLTPFEHVTVFLANADRVQLILLKQGDLGLVSVSSLLHAVPLGTMPPAGWGISSLVATRGSTPGDASLVIASDSVLTTGLPTPGILYLHLPAGSFHLQFLGTASSGSPSEWWTPAPAGIQWSGGGLLDVSYPGDGHSTLLVGGACGGCGAQWWEANAHLDGTVSAAFTPAASALAAEQWPLAAAGMHLDEMPSDGMVVSVSTHSLGPGQGFRLASLVLGADSRDATLQFTGGLSAYTYLTPPSTVSVNISSFVLLGAGLAPVLLQSLHQDIGTDALLLVSQDASTATLLQVDNKHAVVTHAQLNMSCALRTLSGAGSPPLRAVGLVTMGERSADSSADALMLTNATVTQEKHTPLVAVFVASNSSFLGATPVQWLASERNPWNQADIQQPHAIATAADVDDDGLHDIAAALSNYVSLKLFILFLALSRDGTSIVHSTVVEAAVPHGAPLSLVQVQAQPGSTAGHYALFTRSPGADAGAEGSSTVFYLTVAPFQPIVNLGGLNSSFTPPQFNASVLPGSVWASLGSSSALFPLPSIHVNGSSRLLLVATSLATWQQGSKPQLLQATLPMWHNFTLTIAGDRVSRQLQTPRIGSLGGLNTSHTFSHSSGRTVVNVGDVNGDGFSDILLSESWSSAYPSGIAWIVWMESRPPATLLLPPLPVGQPAAVAHRNFSESLAVLQQADTLTATNAVLAAAWGLANGSCTVNTMTLFGNGTLLWRSSTAATDCRGQMPSLEGIVDLNGDGLRELLLGEPRWQHDGANAGRIRLAVSPGAAAAGQGGVLIAAGAITAPSVNLTGAARFGIALLEIGDVTGDQVPDLAVGGMSGSMQVLVLFQLHRQMKPASMANAATLLHTAVSASTHPSMDFMRLALVGPSGGSSGGSLLLLSQSYGADSGQLQLLDLDQSLSSTLRLAAAEETYLDHLTSSTVQTTLNVFVNYQHSSSPVGSLWAVSGSTNTYTKRVFPRSQDVLTDACAQILLSTHAAASSSAAPAGSTAAMTASVSASVTAFTSSSPSRSPSSSSASSMPQVSASGTPSGSPSRSVSPSASASQAPTQTPLPRASAQPLAPGGSVTDLVQPGITLALFRPALLPVLHIAPDGQATPAAARQRITVTAALRGHQTGAVLRVEAVGHHRRAVYQSTPAALQSAAEQAEAAGLAGSSPPNLQVLNGTVASLTLGTESTLRASLSASVDSAAIAAAAGLGSGPEDFGGLFAYRVSIVAGTGEVEATTRLLVFVSLAAGDITPRSIRAAALPDIGGSSSMQLQTRLHATGTAPLRWWALQFSNSSCWLRVGAGGAGSVVGAPRSVSQALAASPHLAVAASGEVQAGTAYTLPITASLGQLQQGVHFADTLIVFADVLQTSHQLPMTLLVSSAQPCPSQLRLPTLVPTANALQNGAAMFSFEQVSVRNLGVNSIVFEAAAVLPATFEPPLAPPACASSAGPSLSIDATFRNITNAASAFGTASWLSISGTSDAPGSYPAAVAVLPGARSSITATVRLHPTGPLSRGSHAALVMLLMRDTVTGQAEMLSVDVSFVVAPGPTSGADSTLLSVVPATGLQTQHLVPRQVNALTTASAEVNAFRDASGLLVAPDGVVVASVLLADVLGRARISGDDVITAIATEVASSSSFRRLQAFGAGVSTGVSVRAATVVEQAEVCSLQTSMCAHAGAVQVMLVDSAFLLAVHPGSSLLLRLSVQGSGSAEATSDAVPAVLSITLPQVLLPACGSSRTAAAPAGYQRSGLQCLCARGFYASSGPAAAAAVACVTCPAGTYSPRGNTGNKASACLQCPDGTYSLVGSASCSSCPRGAICQEGILRVLPGYGAVRPGEITTADQLQSAIQQCPNPSACLSVSNNALQAAGINGSLVSTQCRQGHEGVLCAVCAPGHTHSPPSGGASVDCVPCSKATEGIFVFSLAGGVTLVALTLYLWLGLLGKHGTGPVAASMAVKRRVERHTDTGRRCNCCSWLSDNFRMVDGTEVPTLVSLQGAEAGLPADGALQPKDARLAQLGALIVILLHLQWSSQLDSYRTGSLDGLAGVSVMSHVGSLLPLQGWYTACLLQDSASLSTTLALAATLPLLGAAIALGVAAVAFAVSSACGGSLKTRLGWKRLLALCCGCAFSVSLMMTVPRAVLAILTVFLTAPGGYGDVFVLGDFNIRAESSLHRSAQAVAVTVALLWIAVAFVPVFSSVVFRKSAGGHTPTATPLFPGDGDVLSQANPMAGAKRRAKQPGVLHSTIEQEGEDSLGAVPEVRQVNPLHGGQVPGPQSDTQRVNPLYGGCIATKATPKAHTAPVAVAQRVVPKLQSGGARPEAKTAKSDTGAQYVFSSATQELLWQSWAWMWTPLNPFKRWYPMVWLAQSCLLSLVGTAAASLVGRSYCAMVVCVLFSALQWFVAPFSLTKDVGDLSPFHGMTLQRLRQLVRAYSAVSSLAALSQVGIALQAGFTYVLAAWNEGSIYSGTGDSNPYITDLQVPLASMERVIVGAVNVGFWLPFLLGCSLLVCPRPTAALLSMLDAAAAISRGTQASHVHSTAQHTVHNLSTAYASSSHSAASTTVLSAAAVASKNRRSSNASLAFKAPARPRRRGATR